MKDFCCFLLRLSWVEPPADKNYVQVGSQVASDVSMVQYSWGAFILILGVPFICGCMFRKFPEVAWKLSGSSAISKTSTWAGPQTSSECVWRVLSWSWSCRRRSSVVQVQDACAAAVPCPSFPPGKVLMIARATTPTRRKPIPRAPRSSPGAPTPASSSLRSYDRLRARC